MATDGGPAYSGRGRRVKHTLGVVATAVAIGWTFALLVRVWPTLIERRAEIELPWLLLGIVPAIASNFVVFLAFVSLARSSGIGISWRGLGHLYFTSQLLKHLPGRLWGIGYQGVVGRNAGSFGNWLFINLSHMLFATFFALWAASIVIGLSRHPVSVVAALVAGGGAYWFAWNGWSLINGPRWIMRLPAKVRVYVEQAVEGIEGTSAHPKGRLFVLFGLGCLFNYASWTLYGAGYPSLGASGGAQLCAYYMIAWFIGYASLVTPSGLGVRELVFAWLAKDYPPDAVALMAIIGRFAMLVVDVLLGLAFARLAPRQA